VIRMVRISARLLVLLAAPLLLLTAACGDSGSSGDESIEATESEPFPGVTVSGELGAAPELEIAEPPFSIEETTTEVLIEGDGDTVQAGDQAVLQYLGVNGRTGEEFDSTWSGGGEPVTFALEEGGLIQGFLDGLVGQTYGSRVAVAIPPAAGYGEAGNPQIGVEGDDTLVFVVDLVEAEPPPLSMAEGEEQSLPAGLPELQTDAAGVPTGFESDADTETKADELVAAPAIVGAGPEVEEGQTVTVHYVGQLYPDKKVFAESWTGGQPAEFALQPGALPQGFLDGLIGQPVGSRVVLAIPSDLGYGKQGSGPIPADADLIFAFDILAAS